MTDLDKLIAAVEAGEWKPMAALTSLGSDGRKIDAKRAFDGDLNAAHTLHKAVLPGLRVHDVTEYHDGTWSVEIQDDESGWAYSAQADTPARAWLLAILRAMKEQETA